MIILGSFWDDFGIILGSLWDGFGRFWDGFYVKWLFFDTYATVLDKNRWKLIPGGFSIGFQAPPVPKRKYTFSNNLFQRFYWPVNLAYYTPGKELDKPDYTISTQLQENGVIIGYVIDYGEFSINSELNDLNLININKCK